MSDMCTTCGSWMMFPRSHQCPPKFECVEVDGWGDMDPWPHAMVVFAHDASDAAEKYADHADCQGDYTIVGGSDATVHVRDVNGDVTIWTVSGESVPEYTARPVATSGGEG